MKDGMAWLIIFRCGGIGNSWSGSSHLAPGQRSGAPQPDLAWAPYDPGALLAPPKKSPLPKSHDGAPNRRCHAF
jgi:hypothetical protein